MSVRYVKRGFTLVELLVVIGIIALLIAIILPALNKARQAGVNTKCLANLHAMGQALTMYIAANKGAVPQCYGTNNNSQNFGNYDDMLAPYLPGQARDSQTSASGSVKQTSSIFLCPGALLPVTDYVQVNYACCSAAASQTATGWQMRGAFAYLYYPGNNNPPLQCYTKITQVRRPTECIAIGDANQDYTNGGSWITLDFTHASSSPYTVASTSNGGSYDAYLPTTPNPGQHICVPGGNEDTTTFTWTGLRYRHFEYHHNRDGVANVLFYDGHCAGIRLGNLMEKNVTISY